MPTRKNEIADLLTKLRARGAKVKKSSKRGTAVSAKTLAGLKRAASPQDFEAWISWSKSF